MYIICKYVYTIDINTDTYTIIYITLGFMVAVGGRHVRFDSSKKITVQVWARKRDAL